MTYLGSLPATMRVRVLETKRAEPRRIWERKGLRAPT